MGGSALAEPRDEGRFHANENLVCAEMNGIVGDFFDAELAVARRALRNSSSEDFDTSFPADLIRLVELVAEEADRENQQRAREKDCTERGGESAREVSGMHQVRATSEPRTHSNSTSG